LQASEVAVRFQILGPLVVEADAGAVNLGGPKPRAVLAVLLVHRGTVVSDDRLVEAVWSGRPPRGALSSLRAYVSRLRTALGQGDDRLRHQPPGYRLTVSDDELDAAEFERELAAARAATAAGDHRQALDLLDLGLGRWRGDAFAEFAELDVAVAEAARLDGLRLAAAEERVDALLQLGRHPEAVAAAEQLARRFPTREQTVLRLMRARYAGGRQADALAAYHQLRHRLDDELGIRPSPPTQALYQQILGHDPALLATAPDGNLPRHATGFVGRGREIDDVAAALTDAPLVTLIGVGGVGKSRLAVEVARRVRDRFPDGAWLCELAPLGPGGPVADALAATLQVQQRHGLTIEQTVVSYLQSRSLLLLLDNCEHVLDAAARLVAQLVRHCPEVAVLATSREPLGLGGEQLRPVDPLPAEEAGTLFVLRARDNQPDFRPGRDEAPAVADICRQVDGLPLAIELAAARIRGMSAAEIARRLDGGRLLSRGPRTAPARQQSLAATIDWSYRLLSAAEQRLFTRLSTFAGGCDLVAAHGICADPGATEDDTLDLLTRLVDKSMVTVDRARGRSRYALLQTLRARGHELLGEAGAGPEYADRHAHYFGELAERAAAALHGPDELAWVERTLPDYDNLRAAFEHAAAQRDADLALRLVTSLPELGYLRVGYESARWAERALELTGPDHPLFVAAVGAAARGAWNRGEFARARELAARAGGRNPGRGTGRIAYPGDVLADVQLYQQDAGAALAHYAGEAARARAEADPIRLVWTLYYLAVCHAAQRTPADGLPAAQDCLAVAERTGNPTARSMARYALGLVLKKSEPDRALELFDEASALAAAVRNLWWYGIALMEGAATRAVHRDPVLAARAFLDVLDHWDRVGDRTQQWLTLRYIARLLVRLGAAEEALVLHHALAAAGRPSPFGPWQVAELSDGLPGPHASTAARRGAGLGPAGTIAVARSTLRRHC
jgi:predicted ATPase/DNA-binding SARP family transcriptional activator